MVSQMIYGVGTIAVTLIICGAQKYLSTRRTWQLGAIVPLLSVAVMISLYFVMQVSSVENYVVAGAILVALELFMWADGRHQYRKEELMRMKIKDLN